MVDLAKFCVGTYSWGEMYLQCNECCWSCEESSWETLADLVRLAEEHRCATVVEGALASRQLAAG